MNAIVFTLYLAAAETCAGVKAYRESFGPLYATVGSIISILVDCENKCGANGQGCGQFSQIIQDALEGRLQKNAALGNMNRFTNRYCKGNLHDKCFVTAISRSRGFHGCTNLSLNISTGISNCHANIAPMERIVHADTTCRKTMMALKERISVCRSNSHSRGPPRRPNPNPRPTMPPRTIKPNPNHAGIQTTSSSPNPNTNINPNPNPSPNPNTNPNPSPNHNTSPMPSTSATVIRAIPIALCANAFSALLEECKHEAFNLHKSCAGRCTPEICCPPSTAMNLSSTATNVPQDKTETPVSHKPDGLSMGVIAAIVFAVAFAIMIVYFVYTLFLSPSRCRQDRLDGECKGTGAPSTSIAYFPYTSTLSPARWRKDILGSTNETCSAPSQKLSGRRNKTKVHASKRMRVKASTVWTERTLDETGWMPVRSKPTPRQIKSTRKRVVS